MINDEIQCLLTLQPIIGNEPNEPWQVSCMCIYTGLIISDCYLILIHHNRDIVSSLLADVLVCSYLFSFIKKKSSVTCDVLVDFIHIDFACWLPY